MKIADLSSDRRRFFFALEGLRGLSAVLILEYHVILYFSFDKIWQPFHNHLYLLVDFFFMLSGFLTAHTSDFDMARGISPQSYLIRRIVRLYPMVFIGVILGSVPLIAARHAFPDLSWPAIFTAILSGFLLVPTTALTDVKPYVFPVNSPLWTVSAEVIFCAAYAVTFDWATRRLAQLTAVTAILLVLTSYWAGGLNVGYRSLDYFLGFGRLAFPFVVGIMLRRSRFFQPESSQCGYSSASLLVFAAVNPIAVSWWYDAAVDLVVLPPILLLAANAKPAPLMDRCSKTLGSLAYPLYAVHFPFVVGLANAAKMLHLGPLSAVTAAVGASLLSGATAAVALNIDRRARHRLALWASLTAAKFNADEEIPSTTK